MTPRAYIFAVVLCLLTVSAALADTTVYPSGVFPDDVNRVQTALDHGGTVILKSVNAAGVFTSFNFGTGLPVGQSSGVLLNRDVRIIGETIRSHRTTILGGFLPIQGLVPVKTTIQGIDFESPFWTAITIGASTGSVISDNIVHNVVPVQVRVPSGRTITVAIGIDFSGYDSSGSAPNLISGRVLVAGNTISGAQAIFANGIQFDSFSADIEISRNSISNLNDDTTEAGSGVVVVRAENGVIITNNIIAPGPTQNFGADGILIGGNSSARHLIFGNTIRGIPFSDGIDIEGEDSGTVEPVVVANSITLNGPNAAGIYLFDLVTGAEITANSIQGSGFNAFGVSTFGADSVASKNQFIANDLRHFVSDDADLFFDVNAENNTEIGFCHSVIDLGSGNTSTCEGAAGSSRAQALATPSGAGARLFAAQISPTMNATRQVPQRSFGRIALEQVMR